MASVPYGVVLLVLAPVVAYLWVRQLGYLRVRHTYRTLQDRIIVERRNGYRNGSSREDLERFAYGEGKKEENKEVADARSAAVPA